MKWRNMSEGPAYLLSWCCEMELPLSQTCTDEGVKTQVWEKKIKP